MRIISARLFSSVGKKFVMGFTGLGITFFAIGHLLGNFLLFSNNPDHFNEYSHFLLSLGTILYIVEIGLVLVILFHIVLGVSVWHKKKRAKPVRYEVIKSAGKPSKQNVSSKTMIYTGTALGLFIVFHVITFKYGPYYTTSVNGIEMRDLYRLVVEVFANPFYVVWYVLSMMLLGFHLRHGFWSAFQSLAFYHPRYTPIIYSLGYVIAGALAVGFLVIPIWIYFTGGA